MRNRLLDPTFKIELPNILLIPILSIICGVIKLFDGTASDWISVLVYIPIGVYFSICFGFMILLLLIYYFSKLITSQRTKDE